MYYPYLLLLLLFLRRHNQVGSDTDGADDESATAAPPSPSRGTNCRYERRDTQSRLYREKGEEEMTWERDRSMEEIHAEIQRRREKDTKR